MSPGARTRIGLELGFGAFAVLFFVLGYGADGRDATSFEPRSRAEGVLRVVTWNVGGEDGRPLPEDRERHIVETLRGLTPDLCILQETGGSAQLGRLREGLGNPWQSAVAREENGRHVAALAPGGRLRAFAVPTQRRTALGVRYSHPAGRNLVVVGLHADAFSSKRRNADIGAALDALLARPERGKILTGDLNLDLDLDKRRDLFTDDEYRDVETYNYVASHLVDAAHGRGSTAEPDRRLDYVFVEREAFVVIDAGPWKGQRKGSMDHDPVVADLRFVGP